MYNNFYLALTILAVFPFHCSAQMAKFIGDKDFCCREFALAINQHVSMGEKAATENLLDAIKKTKGRENAQENICLLIRILFLPKDQPIRPAILGGKNLPWKGMPPERWPHFPLVKLKTSVFLVSVYSDVTGQPETPTSYLKYCMEHGRFLKNPLPIPTRESAKDDLENLLKSDEWKSIEWNNEDRDLNVQLMRSQVL